MPLVCIFAYASESRAYYLSQAGQNLSWINVQPSTGSCSVCIVAVPLPTFLQPLAEDWPGFPQ